MYPDKKTRALRRKTLFTMRDTLEKEYDEEQHKDRVDSCEKHDENMSKLTKELAKINQELYLLDKIGKFERLQEK